ncbi:MAG TPA: anti-sigma factor [Xanthobacteraceae bacterium]|jgi:anti-sigma-K factor RskA|nr:anti-sigma factor [Xanthobacteraceae bacterium]
MYDDDRDAMAAEYVLGTLSTDEREQAEALLAIDPGFAEIVRVWERRLGELNVMVEAVEPPAELWDRIQTEIGATAAPEAESDLAAPHLADAAPLLAPEALVENETLAEPGPQFELTPSLETPHDFDDASLDAAVPPEDIDAALAAPRDLDDEATIAALASSLLLPESTEAEAVAAPELEPVPTVAQESRGADVIQLQRGVRRWRGFTAAMTAIAAVLAAFIVVSQVKPELLPNWRHAPGAVTTAAKPPAPGDRFVAVLQQEPTAPAFLLTVNPESRSLTVRRISAGPESGRSYELWLVAKAQAPRSLGLVGSDEFTTRPIPANFDVDAMRGAAYAVSLEPAGGSPSGAPTGPILFTGKMVESLPGSPT